MNQDSGFFTIDLARIFKQIRKNIPVIILVTLAFAVAFYTYAEIFVKPVYSASASMMVNNKNELQDSSYISQQDITASSTLADTYSIILKSHDVMGEVIRDLDLDMSYETLYSMVSVASINDTQVMRITVRDTDGQEALDIVSKIVELAPDAIINSFGSGSVRTTDAPWTNGKPVSPNKKKEAVKGAALGFILCLAWVVLNVLANDKFQSTEDVRSVLDLHVLGVIPEEESEAEKRRNKSLKNIKGIKRRKKA